MGWSLALKDASGFELLKRVTGVHNLCGLVNGTRECAEGFSAGDVPTKGARTALLFVGSVNMPVNED